MTKDRPWTVGFGPVLFKAGETRRIDAQPKCKFKVEKILTHHDLADVHLLAIYIGKNEILQLNGDSIDLGAKRSITIAKEYWCDSALPIEIEIANRSSEEQMLGLSVLGVARL